jgi:cytochrome c-type biogenesis protein CcsB
LKAIVNTLFSFRLNAIILVLLGVSIAVATVIENDFGTETAKAHIYNASWFEMLFILAAINLLGNMFINKVFKWHKLSIFIFHTAFILIIAGAGISRYTGFTGIMHIREGTQSSMAISDEAHLNVQVLSSGMARQRSAKIHLSEIRNPRNLLRLRTGGDVLRIQYIDHLLNARPMLETSNDGRPTALLLAYGSGGSNYHVLYDAESTWIEGNLFHLNRDNQDGVSIYNRNDSLFFRAPFIVSVFHMNDSSRDTLGQDEEHHFKSMSTYNFGTSTLVLSDYSSGARVIAVKVKDGEGSGKTSLSLRLQYANNTKDISIWGGTNFMGEPRQVKMQDNDLLFSYGSVSRILPFSLFLGDFKMDRYPGSESPSAFESRVILRDAANQIENTHTISMNNILKYMGYRFYQSSYDTDEMGTVLSVNHDRWGTIVTYLGYFLLFTGILLSLINPNSRFRSLGQQLTSSSSSSSRNILVIMLASGLLSISPQELSASSDETNQEIPVYHSHSFGEILVQDHQGRIKPLNTLASEAIRKVSGHKRIEGTSPEEALLGMLSYPVFWQSVPMIRVNHPEIQKLLGTNERLVSFLDFFDEDNSNNYRISDQVQTAYRKKSSDRSKFDTEIIRVDERVNICYMIYTGTILRILPDRNDPGHTWHNPVTISHVYTGDDSLFASSITQLYLEAVVAGTETGDWSAADEYSSYIKVFQQRMGGEIIPSNFKLKAEILYNRINVFERLARFYLSISMVLLIIQLINVLGSRSRFSWVRRVMVIHLLVAFGLHGVGLVIRWYVSGHAPWSNGYESLIYIGWGTMLAGVLFSRKSATPLAATAVLAWMILHTAHLSWMDPQMTNLVPVLKSYWLTIHVAVIASSYGFLGLAALLGLHNLVLMSVQTDRNRTNVKTAVQSLSKISEMTVIAGLALLSIGTFLGGIWANESWGRYWAWDAKESWALITILVYAFITHMRFVPGLKNIYIFNMASVLGFGSVLMTYFGVNYYLSGMHSYAAGDPVPVPAFTWIVLAIILLVSAAAYWREYRYFRSGE